MSDSLGREGRARPPYRLAGPVATAGGSASPTRFGSGGGHVDDLIAAYALGALDPAERADVDHHCRGCSRCMRLVEAERRVVGLLPLAVPSAVPAPDVKLALFARVAQAETRPERGVGEASRAIGGDRALLPPTLTIPSSRPTVSAPAVSIPAPAAAIGRRSRLGWGGAVLTVPLLVALVATGAWGWQLRGQVQSQNATANFGAGESWPLVGDEGRGQLIIGADEREALLRMDLDKPNVGGAYRLYGLNEDGEVVPLSELELELDEQGRGEKVFPVTQSLADFQRVQVRARADDNGGNAGEAVLSVSPNGSIGSQNPTANSALP